MSDNVNDPQHYKQHPSGVECIEITEHMNFCLGNAMKYIWRAALKGGIEDLKKAVWYLNREIDRESKRSAVSSEQERVCVGCGRSGNWKYWQSDIGSGWNCLSCYEAWRKEI